MVRLLVISFAGALGTASRYLLAQAITQRAGGPFPYGIVTVNLLGCFAIGLVSSVANPLGWSPTWRAALTTGFLGGFTTYSAFNDETLRLWDTNSGAAVLNVAVTLIGGLVAGSLGLLAGRHLVR